MKKLSALVCVLFVLFARPAAAETAPGKRIVLPANVVPTHYDIRVVPDAPNLKFTGKVVIDVDIVAPTRDIVLNVADLTLAKVELSGESAAPKIKLDDKQQTATFTFASALPKGRRKLTIEYAGTIYEQASGLFALDYGAGEQKKRALFTQFENSDARRFVPCWDEPGVKATFALNVTVPANEMPVSNMPAAKTEKLAGGLKRVQFANSPKMSSYLLFLATGDFERVSRKVGKVDIGVVVKRGDRRRAAYALDATAKLLPFYEKYFGAPYPLPKLDLIAGPGSSQFFGAMENWGAIFYFESILLVDPKTSTERDRRGIYVTVAHEVAHQWFGNLVTMGWWDDLWLNEGFATWMSFKATDHFHPEWNVMLAMVDSKDRAMSRDARVGTHPIIQPILDVLQASQAFDTITYQKGAAVIRMLEDYVGADTFRAGVRKYIAAHAYGNAVTDDLWRALDAVSDADVTKIAHNFTLQEGIPLVRVAEGKTGVRLTQARFALDDSGKKPLAWNVPVIAREIGAKRAWRGAVSSEKPVDAPLASKAGVVVNADQSAYYRTQYEPALFAKLTDKFATLSAADQLGLVYDTRGLGYSGDAPLSNLLGLARQTSARMEPAVLIAVAERIAAIDRLYNGLPGQAAYRAYGRKVLRPVFAKVGWVPKRGESKNVVLLRQTLAEVLSELDDPEVVAYAKKLFAKSVKKPASVSAEDRRLALSITARHADAATWEQLHELAKTAPTATEKERYYEYLGHAVDQALAKRALALALSNDILPTTRPQIIATVADEYPELAFDFVLANREQVMNLIEPTARERYVPGLLGSGNDLSLVGKLKAYADKYIPEHARRAAEVTAGQISLNADVRAKRLPEVDRWIAANNGS